LHGDPWASNKGKGGEGKGKGKNRMDKEEGMGEFVPEV